MKLLDCSSLLPKQKAADILKNYSDKFTIESDGGTGTLIKEESGYIFMNDSRGLYIGRPTPAKGVTTYGGLTYVFGAASVYLSPEDMERWGKRWEYLLENRLIHEILHHFNQPCHNLEIWLPEHHPILYLLYLITGSNGETRIGAYCERIFYRYLLRDVNEEEFDELYSITDRNYKGKLMS